MQIRKSFFIAKLYMTTGEDRNAFNKYVAEIMGRPIFTHELADENIQNEIHDKSKTDFIGLCM